MILSKRLFNSIILFFLLCPFTLLQAAELDHASHAIGFAGGSAQGAGVTYRHYKTQSFYQGQFFLRDNSRNQLTDLMLGISYGKVVSKISVVKSMAPTTLLFVLGGDARYLKNRFVAGVNELPGGERSVHIGAGVALDIGNTFLPGLVFSLGTNYVLALIRKDQQSEWNLAPHVNVGMLYNW